MIRNDFVSNSSSSSFILASDAPILNYFNITMNDLIDVVKELYGKNDITIYNLTTKEGFEKAKEDCLEILNQWDCDYSDIIDDEVQILDRLTNSRYTSLCDALKNIYVLQYFGYGSYKITDDFCMYNTDLGKDVEVPKFVKDLLQDVRKRLGIVTNGDILMSGEGGILVHGEYCLPLEWNKERTYSDTLCKEIFDKLVEKGKINPLNIDFLNKYYESRYEKRPYNTYDGIKYSWEDFKDEKLLVFNNHEG